MSRVTRILRRASALLALLTVLPGMAGAAALSAADRRDVARVEAYLNSLRSLRSDFIQVSSDGGSAEGRLYLRRPRRVRFDYKPPAAIQIYAQGYWLVYVDTELEEVSQVPLNETMAGLLVSKQVRLSGKVQVDKVERTARVIRLHLRQAEQPQAGSLVMTLDSSPLRLRNWSVTDAQGVRTRILLVSPEFNVAIRESVFEFDVNKYERPYED